MSGALGKDIMEAVKERDEVRFGSQLSLTDCREETMKGTISYECDEAKLRLELGSDQIGKHPTCFIKVVKNMFALYCKLISRET